MHDVLAAQIEVILKLKICTNIWNADITAPFEQYLAQRRTVGAALQRLLLGLTSPGRLYSPPVEMFAAYAAQQYKDFHLFTNLQCKAFHPRFTVVLASCMIERVMISSTTKLATHVGGQLDLNRTGA